MQMTIDDKKSILLVEDEAIIAMAEQMQLEKYGYSVQHVATGEKAVQAIQKEENSISLILMDIDLGSGIDGTQAAAQILKHRDIPIIFLSSHTEPELVEKTEKITSYGYVVKNSGIVILDTSIKMAFKLFEANKKLSSELTERKRAEEKIQEMDARMRKLFENVPDLIYQFTRRPDGSYCVPIASKGVRNIFGCAPEDIRDNFEPISRVIYPEDAARVLEDIEYSAKNLSYFTCEFRVHIPGRGIQWILSRSTPEKLADGSVTWYGFNVDITQRKQMESQRLAEEENLRITLNSIGDAVISLDEQGRIARMNPVAETLCGWTEAEAYGKKIEEVFDIINAITRERVDTPVETVMRTGKVVGLANHTILLSKDGKEYQIADSAAPITTSTGDITGVVLVFRDITEQYEKDRQLEERLKELNCLYRIAEIVERKNIELKSIFQETAETITESWLYSDICEAKITVFDMTFQTANFEFTKWLLKSDVIVNGTVAGDVSVCYLEEKLSRFEGPFLKEERQLLNAIAERLGRIIERKQLQDNLHSIEWMLSGKRSRTQKYMPEYGDLTKLNKNGLIFSSIGKDQLQQISSEYLDLLETSSAIYEKNGDYALGLFSSGWCQLLDGASRKLCETDDNQTALSCGKWLCHESCWQTASLESIRTGELVDIECTGGLQLYAVPIYANGEVIGAINFGYGNPPEGEKKLQQISELYRISIEDLEKKRREYQKRPQFIIEYAKKRIQDSARLIGNLVERKQLELELAETAERFTALHNASFGGIAIHDKGIILECNQGLSDMTGYSLEELIGMNGLLLIAPEHRALVLEKITSGYEHPYEANGVTKKGVVFPMRLDARNVPYKGKIVRTVEFRDITERKLAEKEIQKQLLEKETLLREVHHRVKNNIANIESFLTLQHDLIINPEAKTAIKEAISRIQSMRILYDKLLLSKNLQEISMKTYIEDIITSLQNIFADKNNVIIENSITEFNITSKSAITIGIIINELLTNVFKYAFKDHTDGKVHVSIEKKGKLVTVIIQDNGIGIDEQILKNKSTGFGMTIVKMLSEQLKGTFRMENKNGTRSVIQFEI